MFTLSDKRVQDLIGIVPSPDHSNRFIGKANSYAPIGLYGGHLLGQGLNAAYQIIPTEKNCHSFHCYFLSAGDTSTDISYHVEPLREGKRFTVAQVTAWQNERRLMVMTASFKLDHKGDEHQDSIPDVPSPETLRATREATKTHPMLAPITPYGVTFEPLDDWRVNTDGGTEPSLSHWLKVDTSGTLDRRMRQCLLAFISDGFMMFSAVKPHGTLMKTHIMTSLDHSVWFYGDYVPDDWHLLDAKSPVAGDLRGMNLSPFFAQDGRLVAQFAQECMIQRIKT